MQILVTTGGESWLSESVQPGFLSCDALDVVAIHAYGVGDYDTSSIETYIQQAQNAGKKLIMEEWGACYFDTENNNCPTGDPLPADTRKNNIQTWASQITAAGLPWMYWQVLPNADPHVSGQWLSRVCRTEGRCAVRTRLRNWYQRHLLGYISGSSARGIQLTGCV